MMYLWILLAVVVVWAIWQFGFGRNGSPFTSSREDPLEILDRKFASGEISKEEYEARRAILERERTH